MVQINGHIELNLPNNDYHKVKAISKSRLEKGAITLKKFYDSFEASDCEAIEDTDATLIGSALHCRILEPQRWEDEYMVVPKTDGRTKQGKEDKAIYEKIAREEGKTIIVEEDAYICERVYDSVMKHPKAGPLIERSVLREVSLFWNDIETGLPCKCRPDILSMEIPLILDIKSARAIEDHAIERANWDRKHHFIPPHYTSGVETITGVAIEGYVFIGFEKERPFDVRLYTLDALSLQAGANHVRQIMQKLEESYRTGMWPGYSEDIQTFGIPRYALQQYGFDLKKIDQGADY